MFRTEIYQTALSNTSMFILGVFFGAALNITFDSIYQYFDPTQESKRYIFIFGMLQIFTNALVIKLTTEKINEQLGLFSLGLLSAQKLIIKQLYDFV